jgi:hypothetical protein
MGRAAEVRDNLLSTCLGSHRTQAVAYAYGAFTSIGKLGFYGKVIEELERESQKLQDQTGRDHNSPAM